MSRNGYALHTAEPPGYERNIGPRWYSYDLPGLHVVALDWHTHEMGIDHEAQDAWIRADLGRSRPARRGSCCRTTGPGTPSWTACRGRRSRRSPGTGTPRAWWR